VLAVDMGIANDGARLRLAMPQLVPFVRQRLLRLAPAAIEPNLRWLAVSESRVDEVFFDEVGADTWRSLHATGGVGTIAGLLSIPGGQTAWDAVQQQLARPTSLSTLEQARRSCQKRMRPPDDAGVDVG
jgi:hypothetical protein